MELTELKGIGEKTAGALNRLGIFSAEELIWHYPRDYETFEKPVPIYELVPGRVMSVGGVLFKEASLSRYRGMTVVNAYISDLTGRLQLSWYNSPYIRNSLKTGRQLVFRGRVIEKNGRLIMNQPRIYDGDGYEEKYCGKIMPVYPLSKGLTNNTVMKAVSEALNLFAKGCEFLPEELVESCSLAPADAALIRIHFPRNMEELENARRRIVFNEFFMNMLAGAMLSRKAHESKSVYRCRPQMDMIRFMAALPFELTRAQSRAYKEIVSDMNSGRVMNRLIEGDVGSGKTVAAMLAMVYAVLNGYQAAIMVPTAVLAVQHYNTFTRLLESEEGIKIVLLTGSLSARERKEALRDIADGSADIIIGTQALFQKGVEYSRLGLIVTDEQHRFGVGQREALMRKGDMPHTLIMSATPIPRTLAMIMYSGMDISVIDMRPEGRIPVKNCVVGPDYRENAYRFIYKEVKKHHQAYVICPAIEKPEDASESGAVSLTAGAGYEDTAAAEPENVTEYTEKLRKLYPPEVRIAMLHGRMKNEEKNAVMTAFKEHATDVLVSTTVVEVGVDVPDATVMMIENAERYGLAQLHQLRGRVGRGSEQSYCIMINTSGTAKAAERLEVVNHSNDGFKIAEEDLRLRGPGDIFGTRQSGEAEFTTADMYRDMEIMECARKAVDSLSEKDPGLELPEHQAVRRKLAAYLEKGYVL